MHVSALFRYPIKGMAGEACQHYSLIPGHAIPGDRRSALMRADRPLTHTTDWAPKRHFMQGMYTTLLSQIAIDWSPEYAAFKLGTHQLTLPRPVESGSDLSDWLAQLDPSLPPLTLVSRDQGWADLAQPLWSIINLSTVQAIAEATSTQPNPARYRGNLLLEGAAAYEELTWINRTLRLGSVLCRVVEPIVRCKATEVNWSGSRDAGFLDRLETVSPDLVCGLYVETLTEGQISINDRLELLP